MNEAASSVEPEVKTRFANCIRFFLINFIALKHQKCQALKTGVCWFEAATYKKE